MNSIPVKQLVPMNYVRPFAINWENVIDFLYLSATQMFQAPNMIIMAIASTRMYRSVNNSVGQRETPRETKRTAVSDMRVRSLNPADMSVPNAEYGQYPTSHMSGSGSYISAEPHERYKAHEVSLNVDVESGPEK